MLWPWSKTKETSEKVLVITGGDTKDREVLWPAVQDRDRSDPGGAGIPYST